MNVDSIARIYVPTANKFAETGANKFAETGANKFATTLRTRHQREQHPKEKGGEQASGRWVQWQRRQLAGSCASQRRMLIMPS